MGLSFVDFGLAQMPTETSLRVFPKPTSLVHPLLLLVPMTSQAPRGICEDCSLEAWILAGEEESK